MLVSVGAALVVAHIVETPRLLVVGLTGFAVTYLYEGLLLGILALAAGVAIDTLSLTSWTAVAVVSGVVAAVTAWVIRSLMLRFGTLERVDW